MTGAESNTSYLIIRHNVRTYESGGVVEVVRGKQRADAALKCLEDSQRSADHTEGWRYFCEKTNLKAGMDPARATHLREADLEIRESNGLRK